MHALTRPTLALAQDKNHGKCSSTCIDVHNGATSKVECAQFREPPATKHPVSNRRVHKHKPKSNENHVCLELKSVGSCASDECGSDDSEGHLVGAEQHKWNRESERFAARSRVDVAHPGKIQVADEPAITKVSKCQREGNSHPKNRHQAHGEEVLHQHAEHVFGPNHAAIEERESRCHKEHQACRDQHPRGIATVNHEEPLHHRDASKAPHVRKDRVRLFLDRSSIVSVL